MSDGRDREFWRAAALMAAVAERGMALIEVCGKPRVASDAGAMLDTVWDAVTRGRWPDGPDHLRRFERETRFDDPDAEAPDDDTPAYLVDAGQELLYAALWMTYRREPYASPPSVLGPDAWSALDGTVRFARDPRPVLIDPRNPPPPGQFEAREAEAYARDAGLTASMTAADAARWLHRSANGQRDVLRDDIRAALRDVRAFSRTW